MLNRTKFYNAVRISLFGGALTAGQVQGMNYILDMWEAKYQQRTPPTQLAYCLGTTFHETNKTMMPIHEIGNYKYFMRMYDISGARPKIAKMLGNIHVGDGAKYPGRGDTQLTGLANYTKATQKLRELGLLKSTESLVTTPDLAMRPDLSAAILFEGMEDGWFTGVGLDDVIDPIINGDEHADFLKARKIINGTDRAEMIAGYGDKFLSAITIALV